MILNANNNQKRAGVAILKQTNIQNRLKSKKLEETKTLIQISMEKNHMLIIIIIYTPNDRLSKYINQKLTEFEGKKKQVILQ